MMTKPDFLKDYEEVQELGQRKGGAGPKANGHRHGAGQAGDEQHRRQTKRRPQLDERALYGVAGELVRLILPETEAHAAGLLFTFLVFAGNIMGRKPYAMVGNKRHGTNLFVVLVGRTAGGRKGTAQAEIEPVFRRIDVDWVNRCVQTGLSTGEGLIAAVRDPVRTKGEDGDMIVVDEGVEDKRLIALEEEYCGPIKLMTRETNILSAVVRQAWDGRNLGTLTRNKPLRATDPHISVLGHATEPELLKYLTETEMASGFGNRFLWVCVEKSKDKPHGGQRVEYGGLLSRLEKALRFADSREREIKRDAQANALWEHAYPLLSRERVGMWGHMTSRAEAQALRLSVLYALLDCSDVVRVEHLAAALAAWQYCQDAAATIFGVRTGNRDADRILSALQDAGEQGLTLTKINEEVGGNWVKERLHAALDLLEEFGLAQSEALQGRGGGRVYRATT
jgi:hypothetical protein